MAIDTDAWISKRREDRGRDDSVRCTNCAKETPIVESHSYLAVTFGAAKRAQVTVTDADQAAVRAASRVLSPLLAVNWHGSGDASRNQAYPGVYPGIEFNENHPDTPKPPLVELQADLYFCSTACLRHWLNHVVDGLEQMLAAGAVDTQLVNPAAP